MSNTDYMSELFRTEEVAPLSAYAKKPDYIFREDVLALLADEREVCADSKAELKHIRADIRAIPAADVRPVVTCGECKYYKYETCDRWSDGTYLKPNDFCSRAARI